MANLFKKLSNFEATIEIAGHDVEALFDADGLKLKVDADLAMAVLTHLGKLRGAKSHKQYRQPRAQAPERPAVPSVGPPPTRVAKERKEKPAPLPTTDELKAKREEKERERAPEPESMNGAADQQGGEDFPSEPDAVQQVEARQADQFVEDLEVHKAADAAKLVADGKAKAPAALLEARNLRGVVAWMMDQYKLGTAAEVREACTAWRPHVPKLRDLPDASFKARVDNQFEIESHDRDAHKGAPGAA